MGFVVEGVTLEILSPCAVETAQGCMNRGNIGTCQSSMLGTHATGCTPILFIFAFTTTTTTASTVGRVFVGFVDLGFLA